MVEVAVGLPWHNEDLAVAGHEVDRRSVCSGRPGTQPEDSTLAERNGDNRCANDHILDAIPMASYVMAEASVIPINQNAIKP